MVRQFDAMEGVRGRNAVQGLLPRQAKRAYEVAKEITHPWYRCQSLAHAARHIEEHALAMQAIKGALDAAASQGEPNRIVTASSWPMSVLARRDPDRAALETRRLLEVIATEPHTLRRADALIHLFEAVYAIPVAREGVLAELMAALRASHGWRAERLLRFTALIVARDDSTRALELLGALPDCREARRARRMIESRQWLGPHEFWPHYAKPQSGAT
jgi:hypothetical protein